MGNDWFNIEFSKQLAVYIGQEKKKKRAIWERNGKNKLWDYKKLWESLQFDCSGILKHRLCYASCSPSRIDVKLFNFVEKFEMLSF